MNRIYNNNLGDGDPVMIDLGKVVAVEEPRDPGRDTVIVVHFVGGGFLSLLESQHQDFKMFWINYIQSFEREEVTHGR